MHRNQAGGYYPPEATYRKGASWLPKTMRFDTYVDHLCRTLLGRASRRPAAEGGLPGHRRSAGVVTPSITKTHAAATWKFVRLANALLDSPDHMTT